MTKFGLVGASGVIVNLGIFTVLTVSFSLHYLVAGAIGIETALCTNYLLNNNWTFADRRTGFATMAGLARHHAVSVGGVLINVAVLHTLVGTFGVLPVLANLAGIVTATGWNFCLSLGWTWRRPSATPARALAPHASIGA